MEDPKDVKAIKRIMQKSFSLQKDLQDLAPQYKWAGNNLLGDYGEFLAMSLYNLDKAPTGSSGYDATNEQDQTVQVKTNHAASMIGYRGEADLMLVLHIDSTASWEEVYYGDFSLVKENSGYSKRDSKHTITIAKLRKLQSLKNNEKFS